MSTLTEAERLKVLKEELDAREEKIKEREDAIASNEWNFADNMEFRNQTYGAVYNTVLEKDKSILTLCGAGLGFAAVTLQQKDISSGVIVLVLLSTFGFLSSMFTVLYIFSENSKFLAQILNNGPRVDDYQSKLQNMDLIASVSFYLAVVLSVLAGIGSADFFHR